MAEFSGRAAHCKLGGTTAEAHKTNKTKKQTNMQHGTFLVKETGKEIQNRRGSDLVFEINMRRVATAVVTALFFIIGASPRAALAAPGTQQTDGEPGYWQN